MPDLSAQAFDGAPIGLVLTENRIIRACNSLFCTLSGHPRAALIGQSFRLFYDSEAEFDRVRDIGLTALATQGAYADDRLLRRADGSHVWCRFRARSLTPEAPLTRMVLSFAPLEAPQTAPLTPRERDVLAGLARGETSKQIARGLSLSPRSIEDVRARLLRKFNVPNAAALLSRVGNSG